jgi:hypothetical protein
MTDDQWREHFRRLNQSVDPIETCLDRTDAHLEAGWDDLTVGFDRLDAQVDRLASTRLVVAVFAGLSVWVTVLFLLAW